MMAMPHVRLWCPGRCQMPGRAGPACPEPCFKAPEHDGRCGCELHATQPFLAPAVIHPPADTFAALLRWCADKGGPAVALDLRSKGFATLTALQAAGPQALLDAGAPVESAVLALTPLPRAEPPRQLATLRRDHPVLRPTKGGRLDLALAAAATPESRKQALEELHADFYAQSSGASRDSIWKTWRAIAAAWQIPPVPLSAETVFKVAASLKAGGYRAPQQYVARARLEHVKVTRRSPSPAAKQAIRDAIRSARRGMGPTTYKDSIPFERVAETAEMQTPESVPSLPAGSPVDPAAMVILGTWWFTRGIEISAALAMHIRMVAENRTVGWTLPVSKRDTAALGEDRVHGCCCSQQARATLCPFHTMQSYLKLLCDLFGEDALAPARGLPLFPDVDGNPLTKNSVKQAIASVIAATGEALQRVGPAGDMRERFGEHVLRVMGAQFLARSRIELFRIQLFARWGSDAILRYVQDAPLAVQHELAAEVSMQPSLRDIALSVGELRHEAPNGQVLLKKVADRHQTAIDALREAVVAIEARLVAKDLAQQLPDQGFVRNTKSGVIHKVLYGDVNARPDAWLTRCPWKFGLSTWAERCGSPEPGQSRCDKCFPDEAACARVSAVARTRVDAESEGSSE